MGGTTLFAEYAASPVTTTSLMKSLIRRSPVARAAPVSRASTRRSTCCHPPLTTGGGEHPPSASSPPSGSEVEGERDGVHRNGRDDRRKNDAQRRGHDWRPPSVRP